MSQFKFPELKLPNTPLTKDLKKKKEDWDNDKKAIELKKKAIREAEKSRFHNNNNDLTKLAISFATSIVITLTCAIVGCNFLFFTKLDADSLEAIFPISSRYYNILEDPKTSPTPPPTPQVAGGGVGTRVAVAAAVAARLPSAKKYPMATAAAAAVAAAGCNDNTPIRIYDKRPDDYPRSDQKRQFPWENIDAKNEIRLSRVGMSNLVFLSIARSIQYMHLLITFPIKCFSKPPIVMVPATPGMPAKEDKTVPKLSGNNFGDFLKIIVGLGIALVGLFSFPFVTGLTSFLGTLFTSFGKVEGILGWLIPVLGWLCGPLFIMVIFSMIIIMALWFTQVVIPYAPFLPDIRYNDENNQEQKLSTWKYYLSLMKCNAKFFTFILGTLFVYNIWTHMDNTYGYISLGLYFMYIVKKLVSLYKESTDGTMKGGMRKQNAKKK